MPSDIKKLASDLMKEIGRNTSMSNVVRCHMKQAIIYGAEKMHKNSIMGTRYVYNWTEMMVDMDPDNIVHNDREPIHARIFNAWIED